MSKQNYCLTPEEEHYAKACLTLAKRWGLIDDDSFSALDLATDARLRAGINKTLGDKNIIIVAQRIGTIMNADRILVMYEGEIVGELDPEKTTVEELGLYMAGAKKEGRA